MFNILKIEKDKSALKIKWSDGKESNFNFLWLRDNCPTAHDKDSRHRMFNILKVSENINIISRGFDENPAVDQTRQK